MHINRGVITCFPQQIDQALRFAKRVNAYHMAALRKAFHAVQKFCYFSLRRWVLKDRKPKSCFGHKNIALDGFERGTGAIRETFIVPRDYDLLAFPFQ